MRIGRFGMTGAIAAWGVFATATCFSGIAQSAEAGVYDGAGEYLGKLLTMRGAQLMEVLSPLGYVVAMSAATGQLGSGAESNSAVVFLDDQCLTSKRIASDVAGVVFSASYISGNQFVREIVSIAPDEAPIELGVGEIYFQEALNVQGARVCLPVTVSQRSRFVFSWRPNVASQTGVTNPVIARPIRLRLISGDWTLEQLSTSGFEQK